MAITQCVQCLDGIFQLAALVRCLFEISHATLNRVIGFGHPQQAKGRIPFEDRGSVFDRPLMPHSHALLTPSRPARILFNDSASSSGFAIGYLGLSFTVCVDLPT